MITGNFGNEILKLKQEPGKDRVVMGGTDLASSFINLNLVDEYQQAVNPGFLGNGKSQWNTLPDKTAFDQHGNQKNKT